MKKEIKMAYETPWMECMQIEAEGNFAGSVVDDKPVTKETQVSSQEVGFEKDFGETDITWE